MCSVLVKVVYYMIEEQNQKFIESSPNIQFIPYRDSSNLEFLEDRKIEKNMPTPNLLPYQYIKNPTFSIETNFNQVGQSLEEKSEDYNQHLVENVLKASITLDHKNEIKLINNFEETKKNDYDFSKYNDYNTNNIISTKSQRINIPEEKKLSSSITGNDENKGKTVNKNYLNNKEQNKIELCHVCEIKLQNGMICTRCKLKKCDSCMQLKKSNSKTGFCKHYLCLDCFDQKCCCVCDPNNSCKGCKKPWIYLKNLCNHKYCEDCRKNIKQCPDCKCKICGIASNSIIVKKCGHSLCIEHNNKLASCNDCKKFIFNCKEHKQTFISEKADQKRGFIEFTCCKKNICLKCRWSKKICKC